MINCLIKTAQELKMIQGLPDAQDDGQIIWLEITAPTVDEATILRSHFGIEVAVQRNSVMETDDLLYLRTDLLRLTEDGTPQFGRIHFILGEHWVATLSHNADFQPYNQVIARLRKKSRNHQNPRAVLRVLLRAANDMADNSLDHITDALECLSEHIFEISEGYSADGRELGVKDLLKIMRRLNEKEELISRCLESQLSLARAVRYLSGEVDSLIHPELEELVNELAADVTGVKEHAYFEHEKVRYLQNAVTNILNIKQNQIVKIFTIITAVFLPPTLVGTFYGMNFSVMPELSWKYGFIYSMILTVAAALLPLIYIKRKGWLR